MRSAVREAFISFTTVFEGSVPWLYADVKGLVTVAIGNLVDPVEYALGLPFVWPDGTPATTDDIRRAWEVVKNDPRAAKYGHKYTEHLAANQIRLTPGGLENLVLDKFDANEKYLAKRFIEWDQWPADAQLGVHSMAWACGPAFRFPHLESSLRDQDFDGAALNCSISTAGNPGVIPRNVANRTLFSNASRVVEFDLDPDRLYYPGELTDDPASFNA
jgi:hypothetical protein